ncbi:MAG: long-chain fatty acid--CoA ligase [Acidimicrobiia bacterium]|nr:long-chain fatty acid--CoA ligase [Acidimicrobiia bacterium]
MDVSGPPLIGGSEDNHLLASVKRHATENPDRAMVSVRVGDAFVDRSAADVWQRVEQLAKGLIAAGIESGDRVALMSATRVEWVELDLAINLVGAVTVPIYETSSPDQIGWILTDSEAAILVVESDEMLAAARSIETETACREILVIESGGLDELIDRGVDVGRDDLDDRLEAITPDDIATLIYTSGTTGRPKGCVLTHRNLRVNVDQVADALAGAVDASDTALLFLPLAHVLTKTTALFCLATGIRIAFGTSIANLPDEFAMVRPTLIAAVPRIFEKVYSRAQHTAEADGKGRIFDRAVTTAIRWSRQRVAGRITAITRAEHWVFDRLVYRRLSAAFGGELRMAFSGGGPLGERLTSFFDGVGVRIYEGYGLTETSPLVTINRTDAWRPGSVGRAVADTSIKIEADGEVLVKGPQVFPGYWRNDRATAEVFDDDGWFHTGDIGTIDQDGFLLVTGRKKELIVTSAGKNVAPAPLEDRLRSHNLVSQAMIVGDAQRFIAALVTIDEEAFVDWAQDHDHPGATVADLATSDELRKEIQEAIDVANASVSRAESIREFVILPADLSLEQGEITPTLKVRRAVVAQHYEDTIKAIYG